MKLKLNDEHVTFNVCQLIRKLKDMQVVSMTNTIDENASVTLIEESGGFEVLVAMIMTFYFAIKMIVMRW